VNENHSVESVFVRRFLELVKQALGRPWAMPKALAMETDRLDLDNTPPSSVQQGQISLLRRFCKGLQRTKTPAGDSGQRYVK
jgi:hypothetical protein